MKKVILVTAFLITSAGVLFAQKSEVFNPSDKAIRGYDPVAYFTEGKAVKGNENLPTIGMMQIGIFLHPRT